MIKNLIFDWGNVLIDVSVERFAKSCKAFGIQFADDEVGSAHKAGFFLEYEKGNLSDCEFRNEIRARASVILSDEEVDSVWNGMLGRIPVEKLQLLYMLKDTYNLYLLSNTNSIHWNTFSKKSFDYRGLNADDFFKGIYLSYKLHTAKPDSVIFHKAVEDAGIDVRETLFIDDSFANCMTARSLGMSVLHYKPGDNLESCILKELEQKEVI
ncbi:MULTISPECIES: HAD family hydrolase [Bacteroides]|uniref:HAD family hydrolase n=1 Tax=Bacteroides TaxID=816 RepID=UPI000B3A901A|nr:MULTISPECIES: HAD family phosphatase [Bacteroides]MBM6657213.1 HAD family phosphatase [Bacteroides gallinaceum]OUO84331.1 hypothetical protein B5F71_01975 [Bacteroides sp. An269]